ncbi:MAG: RNA-binding protein [Methanoregulaceae archaeon]|nr:RNA-binding protein [Methanoregulaceae archaeon]
MKKVIGRKRHSIRKAHISILEQRLREEIGESAGTFLKDPVEIVETNTTLCLYLSERKPVLMEGDGILFPTIRGALEHPFPERKIVVDAGAVPYVVNGADVMRPGVVLVTDDVQAGKPVQIAEERHGKVIATGIALFGADEIRAMKTGKVCRNLHHVGDDIWNIEL